MAKRLRNNWGGQDDGTYPYRPTPVIYRLPPIESTIIVDVNGNSFTNTVGGFPNNGLGYNSDIPIATSIRGAKSLQYDDAIYQNDFFTHNYTNALIGLAVTMVGRNTAFSPNYAAVSAIIPLFVARGKRTISVTDDGQSLYYSDVKNIGNSQQKILGENLAYELNLRFAGIRDTTHTDWPAGIFNDVCITSQGLTDMSQVMHFPVFASDYTATVFQNGVTPIRFYQFPSANGNGGHLVVAKNPDCQPIQETYSFDVYMNFITIRNFMVDFRFGERVIGNVSYYTYPRQAVYGEVHGWNGQGPHVYGTGVWSKTGGQNNDTGDNFDTYADDYTNDEARAYFNFTSRFAVEVTPANFPAFENTLLTTYKLKKNVLSAQRTFGFCPSRYYMVCSKAITRNQRIAFTTNSSCKTGYKSKSCMGLVYTELLSPHNRIQEMFYTEKEPVIGMRGTESRDSMDLEIIDEWGNTIETFNADSPAQAAYLKCFEQARLLTPPGSIPIPAYFQTLNPLPTLNPTGEPLCGYQNVNENGFCLSSNPDRADGRYNSLLDVSYGYEYMYPVTSKMTHFIRVLGVNQ